MPDTIPAADREITRADNFGDDGFANELAAFEERCARLAKEEPSEETKGLFADLRLTKRQLAKAAEEIKAAEKAPILAAGRQIDATFNARIDKLDKAARDPLQKFDAWIIAEDAKREAAAKAAREEAARAEREAQALARAAESEANPFDAADAAEAAEVAQIEAVVAQADAMTLAQSRTRVASAEGIGRALSVRTTEVIEVEDHALAFPSVAANKAVKEAIEKAVRASFKANGIVPPGCKTSTAKAVR